MKTNNVQHAYVDLDSLLDTRIGVVGTMSPEAAIDILDNPGYQTRDHDNLGDFTDKITTAAFREEWEKRAVGALTISRPTEMLVAIPLMFEQLEQDMISTPFVKEISLDVNVWPYKLSDEEKADIIDVMRSYLGPLPNIHVIDRDPKTIKPKEVFEKYSLMIMYEFNKWLEPTLPRLQTDCRLVQVTFVAPAIYKDKVPGEEELCLEEGKPVNAFAVTEYLLSPYIHICYQDARTFSLVSSKALESYAKRERELRESFQKLSKKEHKG